MKPLEVELPVCPECLRVGKWPNGRKMDFSCTGGADSAHRQTKMKKRVFREVVR